MFASRYRTFWLPSAALILFISLPAKVCGADSIEDVYRKKNAAIATTNAEGHVELATWAANQGKPEWVKEQLEKAIGIKPNQAEARKRLGYELIGATWLRGDELKIAKGLVQYHGRWVLKAEAEARAKGLVKNAGTWVAPEELAKKGYVKYRGQWLTPAQRSARKVNLTKACELVKNLSTWNNAQTIPSEHFLIKSNLPPQMMQEISISMEKCYTALVGVFNATPKMGKILVEVCANEQQFRHLPDIDGLRPPGAGVAGYFYYGGTSEGVRAYYLGSIERTISTIFHECTHLVEYKILGSQIPIWFNEGLAVYVEDAELTEKGLNLQTVPWTRLWHLKKLIADDKVDLDHLCRISGSSYTVDYYPQGWSLIYFLGYGENKKLQPAFFALQNLIQRNKWKGISTFKEAVGVDPSGLHDRWKVFFSALEPSTTSDLLAATEAATNEWVNLNDAQTYIAKAIAQKPNDPAVMLGDAHFQLTRARLSIDEAPRRDAFQSAVARFEEVWPPPIPGKITRPIWPSSSSPLALRRFIRQRIDYAYACMGAGYYDQALTVINDILDKDPYCAAAFVASAYLAVDADDPAFRDIESAKTDIAIAQDLGGDHTVLYVRALIALAAHDSATATTLLSKAAEQDQYGFGALYYRFELKRRLSPVSEPTPEPTAPSSPPPKSPLKNK